jgi:hypothetical protein
MAVTRDMIPIRCWTCHGEEKLCATNTEAALARHRSVAGNLSRKSRPSPGRDGDGGTRAARFVVCYKPKQAERDAAVRAHEIAHHAELILPARTTAPAGAATNSSAPSRLSLRRMQAGFCASTPLQPSGRPTWTASGCYAQRSHAEPR